tara:strand:+ start:172 stop:708 length:537 start_codon:yes stop_codon:yes gene_type:complete
MPLRFDLLPDEIIEKIFISVHSNSMKNVIEEIKKKDEAKDFSKKRIMGHNGILFRNILKVKDNRFLLQNATYYIKNDNNWFEIKHGRRGGISRCNMVLVNYWLNNITLCKYIFTKEHMLSIFNLAHDIHVYIRKIIYSKTNDKKKPLQQFQNIYLRKIGYKGKYLNTWKKAFEQLWMM